MGDRNFNSNEFRYGFCSAESDNEVRGDGSAIEYGGRSIFDPRLARFISVDPREREFVSMSPYVYAANCPIMLIDQDGAGPTLPPLYDPENKWSKLAVLTDAHLATMMSFSTAQNSSLSHLQKFLWSDKGSSYYKNTYNKIKGVVGEGLTLKFLASPLSQGGVLRGTLGMGGWSPWKTGDKLAELAISGCKYSLHPDKYTDLKVVAQASEESAFHHQFVKGYSNFLGLIANKDYRYTTTTTFIYEIKTNNVDGGDIYTAANITKGYAQLVTNEAVKNGAVPVLVLDEAYLKEAFLKHPAIIKVVIDGLTKYGGGIYYIPNLNQDSKNEIKALDTDKSQTDAPPAGYYNYDTPEE